VARKQDGGALRQHARKECARSIRLQRTVNADVASLHFCNRWPRRSITREGSKGRRKESEAAALTGGVSAAT